MRTQLELDILPQPDDVTCGPTCLHAVYRYFGEDVPLKRVIDEVPSLRGGGTLAVQLAGHALRRGYGARIYTYNLHLFDPSWFQEPRPDIAERLRAQAAEKADAKLREATDYYLEFLDLGGELKFQELAPSILRRYLKRNRPILTGLSATYLYACQREYGATRLVADDVRGVPTGHFVVLYGYDQKQREVLVADPLQENPPFGSHYYAVGVQRVLGAILLGVLTYDANFLVLNPPTHHAPS